MRNEHTPGPWNFSQSYLKNIDGFQTRVRQITPAAATDDMQIAIVQGSDYSDRDIEHMANARIMSKAPEMLKALRDIYELSAVMRVKIQSSVWAIVGPVLKDIDNN